MRAYVPSCHRIWLTYPRNRIRFRRFHRLVFPRWTVGRALSVALILASIAVFAADTVDSPYPPQQLLDRITPQGIRSHMEFLADDLLEGRGAGTRGYLLAANYIRAQFEEMGLAPAGNSGSYFQSVHLREVRPVPERDSLLIKRGDGQEKLVFEKDYVMVGNPVHEDIQAEAPLVFAGFGVTAPEEHYDDYAGIDARGKIVVTVFGAPPNFGSSQRGLYSDS